MARNLPESGESEKGSCCCVSSEGSRHWGHGLTLWMRGWKSSLLPQQQPCHELLASHAPTLSLGPLLALGCSWAESAPGIKPENNVLFVQYFGLAQSRHSTSMSWDSPSPGMVEAKLPQQFHSKTQRQALPCLWTKPTFKPLGGWCKDTARIWPLVFKRMDCLQEIRWVWLLLFLMVASLLQITLLLEGYGFSS